MLGYTDSNKNHYPVLKYKIELRLKSRYYVSYYTKTQSVNGKVTKSQSAWFKESYFRVS